MIFDDLLEGDELPTSAVDLAAEFVRDHAADLGMASGRFSNDKAARAEGLPGQILPGVMSMGLLARMLLKHAPHARVTRLGTTFRGLVLAGQKVQLHAMITEKDQAAQTCEIDLWLETEAGDRNVVGTATLSF
ncbi:MAG: MaoC/PaaZ C-terminal domain-containing protein [Deltaproteobacteria bacterium]